MQLRTLDRKSVSLSHEVLTVEVRPRVSPPLHCSRTPQDDCRGQLSRVAVHRHCPSAGESTERLLHEATSFGGEGENASLPRYLPLAKKCNVVIQAMADADHCSSRASPDALLTPRMNHGNLAIGILALNAYMHQKSTPAPQPIVTYPALVGKLLAQRREQIGLKQGQLAGALGVSQSAYSRLESGESVLNLAQLRNVCAHLGVTPAQVLQAADQYESLLHRQGVEVVAEKPTNPAAIAIGLGLLAALFLGSK